MILDDLGLNSFNAIVRTTLLDIVEIKYDKTSIINTGPLASGEIYPVDIKVLREVRY
ncbi:hypothetical protein ALGA_0429 [Labilibaculum antarcticum]|uniref:Uncharacterized protein n=1 Tax=Labilibaculum antarcticum TaxID=1717717 RepID=A0A1Y1CFE3_9BACT|nr:hypothetical protein ALGA_0429 [Labilibaculum antarcticum]